MKKIFISLSLFIPLFCWANDSFNFSINNKLDFLLPTDIKKMYRLETDIADTKSTPIDIFVTDKGYKIYIYTTYDKENIKDKSLYDYYFEMFTNPKTEKQKNFYEQMKPREPKEIKGEDYVIFSYPFFEKQYFYIFSKKLNFVTVVAVYPKKIGEEIINKNTILLR
ncbi:hypothetical protein LO80_03205 [Candidatus Francisella endociliophora]|uniref:Uncharacterized protein n=1 Tax=Candidatus Francisella endociliophora TaxID=653937 RepID=A0A097END5_9GAMM|nr:hypothetical protein [Francisella sp. FSC1006]AIT09077.1 hypothetical protein LO80_03205 [Francisella sp. FSC1006]